MTKPDIPDAAFDGLPHSSACDRNREPLLDALGAVLRGDERVLEIGSGTGQHAVYFAAALPGISWQCSDRDVEGMGLSERIRRAGLANLPPPRRFDVDAKDAGDDAATSGPFDVVFTANTLHIVSEGGVKALLAAAARRLRSGGQLLAYGPFRYGGRFTSASNAAFDESLRQRDPSSGVRDAGWVDVLARAEGLTLIDDRSMPANNQLRRWRR
jgi:SAM-dependent methyltransferase